MPLRWGAKAMSDIHWHEKVKLGHLDIGQTIHTKLKQYVLLH